MLCIAKYKPFWPNLSIAIAIRWASCLVTLNCYIIIGHWAYKFVVIRERKKKKRKHLLLLGNVNLIFAQGISNDTYYETDTMVIGPFELLLMI